MPAKKKAFTATQLYTGRAVTIKSGATTATGKVSNGGQCSETQFAYSGPVDAAHPYGDERCVARSAIVSLGK
jgi:hypothetical protein